MSRQSYGDLLGNESPQAMELAKAVHNLKLDDLGFILVEAIFSAAVLEQAEPSRTVDFLIQALGTTNITLAELNQIKREMENGG